MKKELHLQDNMEYKYKTENGIKRKLINLFDYYGDRTTISCVEDRACKIHNLYKQLLEIKKDK